LKPEKGLEKTNQILTTKTGGKRLTPGGTFHFVGGGERLRAVWRKSEGKGKNVHQRKKTYRHKVQGHTGEKSNKKTPAKRKKRKLRACAWLGNKAG